MLGRYWCDCGCHSDIRIHISATCDCGKPARPPKPCCPVPPIPDQPGVVNIPQETPPPPPRTRPAPVWTDRPQGGGPGEINWFRGVISEVLRKGPTFGPRRDEYLPYLVVRASSTDRGTRPLSSVFWESPDIFVLPNVSAAAAPLQPPQLGNSAVANAPNTLYAHVWNLGKAPAYRVRVEFYWFNPSLGISRADAHLIGAAYVDLGNRFEHSPTWQAVEKPYGTYLSRGAHAIVRCPETWVPVFENGGHECLVVRAFEPIKDAVDVDQFSPVRSRHVAQRNIAVVLSQSPATIDLALDLGHPTAPGSVSLEVEVGSPATMEFLKLYAGRGGPAVTQAKERLVAGLMPPTPKGAALRDLCGLPFDCLKCLLHDKEAFRRECELLRVGFHASVEHLAPNEAHLLRIRQKVDGDLVGGYSVVLLGR